MTTRDTERFKPYMDQRLAKIPYPDPKPERPPTTAEKLKDCLQSQENQNQWHKTELEYEQLKTRRARARTKKLRAEVAALKKQLAEANTEEKWKETILYHNPHLRARNAKKTNTTL